MNSPDIRRGIRPSDQDRAKILDQITKGYGDGRISRDEHDARVSAVQVAASIEELSRLAGDLPAADPSGKDIRRTRSKLIKQARMSWIQKSKTSGALTWRRWQWGLVGCLFTGFLGVVFAIPVPIVVGKATNGLISPVLRDLIVGVSIPFGLLLVVIAICMANWLFDAQKNMRGRGK